MPVTPDDLGSRVSVRRRLGTEAGREVYGDVVGDLVTWVDGVLRIRRRDGSVVDVRAVDVVAGKVVPPPVRARRQRPRAAATSPEALERVAAAGWRAPETAALGDWLLRAAGGFTGRANSALAVGDPGTGLDAALAEVLRWYAARGLTPRVQVVHGSALDHDLGACGWRLPDAERHRVPTLVQAADLAEVLDRLDGLSRRDDVAVTRVDATPDEGWLDLYRVSEPLPPVAHQVLTGHPRVGFASLGDDPRRAVGRVVVDEGWAGLSAVEVAPAFRRRGYARAVARSLLGWAGSRGARQAYLQVVASNAPALALYAGMGFATHHSYVYRVPGPGAAEAGPRPRTRG